MSDTSESNSIDGVPRLGGELWLKMDFKSHGKRWLEPVSSKVVPKPDASRIRDITIYGE